MVILESVIDRVWDRRECLPLFTVAKLFLLNFDLVSDYNIAVEVHRLDQDRNDEHLYNALLLVVDAHTHMRASLDLYAGQRLVCDSLMVAH